MYVVYYISINYMFRRLWPSSVAVDVCCLLHKYQLHVSALMAIFRLNELTKKHRQLLSWGASSPLCWFNDKEFCVLHIQSNTTVFYLSVDKKNQLDVTFCILYFSSNICSTCFGQPCAHHQELTTAWCYCLVLVCAVAAGRMSRPVGR